MLTYRQIVTPFEQFFVSDDDCPELQIEAKKGILFLGTVIGSNEEKFGKRTKEEVVNYYKERLTQLVEQGYYFDLPPIHERIIEYNLGLLNDTLDCKTTVLLDLFEVFYVELEKAIKRSRVKVDPEYNTLNRYELEQLFRYVAKKSKIVTSDFMPAIYYC